MLIDAHCHLDDPRLNVLGLDVILQTCALERVVQLVTAGFSPLEWPRQHLISERYDRVFCCYGIHPWYAASLDEASALVQDMAKLAKQLASEQTVGLGEIGLDYSKRFSEAQRRLQMEYLVGQLELAKKQPLPLVLHCVKAHNELIAILKAFSRQAQLSGFIHGFSSSAAIAKQYLDLGLDISLNPSWVLQIGPNHPSLLELAAVVPKDRLLLESDAPSGLVTPARLPRLVKILAIAWQVSTSELGRLTTQRARERLKLPVPRL